MQVFQTSNVGYDFVTCSTAVPIDARVSVHLNLNLELS